MTLHTTVRSASSSRPEETLTISHIPADLFAIFLLDPSTAKIFQTCRGFFNQVQACLSLMLDQRHFCDFLRIYEEKKSSEDFTAWRKYIQHLYRTFEKNKLRNSLDLIRLKLKISPEKILEFYELFGLADPRDENVHSLLTALDSEIRLWLSGGSAPCYGFFNIYKKWGRLPPSEPMPMWPGAFDYSLFLDQKIRDFSGADLRRVNTKSTDRSTAIFRGACLDRAAYSQLYQGGVRNFSCVEFSGDCFKRLNFSGITLSGARLPPRADYSEIALDRNSLFVFLSAGIKSLVGVSLKNVDLSGMDLRGLDFTLGTFCNVNFDGANLSGAKFHFSDFIGVRNLEKANLADTILNGAQFSGRRVNLHFCFLYCVTHHLESIHALKYLMQCYLGEISADDAQSQNSALKKRFVRFCHSHANFALEILGITKKLEENLRNRRYVAQEMKYIMGEVKESLPSGQLATLLNAYFSFYQPVALYSAPSHGDAREEVYQRSIPRH